MNDYTNIPDSLKTLPIFCLWQKKEVITNGQRRITKKPVSPKDLQGLDTGAIARYATFDETVKAFQDCAKKAILGGGFRPDGIGLGIFQGQGYPSAIDIDHCVVDGKVEPLAQKIVDIMRSYTELSPSGTGLHIIFMSDCYIHDTRLFYEKKDCIGLNSRGEKIGLELYTGASPRYITLTGETINTGRGVEERSSQVKEIAERFLRREEPKSESRKEYLQQSPRMEDSKIIETMLNAKNAEAVRPLWTGERIDGGDHSSLDMSLMNILTFYTQDPEQLDRLFRCSGLNRDKWEQRADYRDMTISKALEARFAKNEFFGVTSAAADFSGLSPDRFAPIPASAIAYRPVKWLLEPYFYRGKLNLVSGNPGVGKTAFGMGLAACISSGRPFCGITPAVTGKVLILSVEDDQSTLRGRLEANGAALDNCIFLDEGATAELTFDHPMIEKMITGWGIRLVIFDPFQNFLGAKVDMHRANETRPVLAKLAAVAERTECAVLMLAHNGKVTKDKAPVYLSLGSVDIPAACRSVLNILRDPSDPDTAIAVQNKNSCAKQGLAITYSIGDRGAVVFKGFRDVSASEGEAIEKRMGTGCKFEDEPLVVAIGVLLKDHPSGGRFSYDELREAYFNVQQTPLCSNTREIPQMVKRLSNEMSWKNGWEVLSGCRCKHGGSEKGIEVIIHK